MGWGLEDLGERGRKRRGKWVLLDGWLLAQQHYSWFRIAQETNFAPLYNSDDSRIMKLFKNHQNAKKHILTSLELRKNPPTIFLVWFACALDLFWSFKPQIWVQTLGPHWHKTGCWHVWGQISFIQLEHLSKLDYCSDRSPVTFPPSPVSCRKKGKNIIPFSPTSEYQICLVYF